MSEVKILLGGDLHKRAKDITTIEGYVRCTNAVQRALMSEIVERGIDYFISLGDWYDKGYASDISASLADYDLDIKMNEILGGKFYGVIGNHIRLSMDSNPELHLIQPHPVLKSRRGTNRQEQIIKTPEVLRIHDVQISFMHYNMNYEKVIQYKPSRQPWAKYHIALFHTPLIIPNAQLMNTQYGYNISSNGEIARTLEDVDLAIVGDIHKPIGKFNIDKGIGITTMIVPGSLTNTDAGLANNHTSVMLPLITISDNSEVTLEFLPFDLKTNMLTFKRKTVEESRESLKTLRGNSLEQLHDTVDVVAALGGRDESLMSLNGYMLSKGYTDKDRKLVRKVIDKPEDLAGLCNIYVNAEEK